MTLKQRIIALLSRTHYFIYFAVVMLITIIPGAPRYTQYLTKILLVWAIYLFIRDFFTQKRILKSSYIWLMLLFFVSIACTILLTDSAHLFSNMTARAHTFFMVTLLYAYDVNTLETEMYNVILKCSRILATVSSTIAVASFWFFIINQDYFSLDGGVTYEQGFCGNRLFGFYNEPNYGAAIVSVSIILCLISIAIIYFHKKRVDIYFTIMLLLNYLYFALSRSRGGLIGMSVAVFVIVLFVLKNVKPICVKGMVIKINNINWIVAVLCIVAFLGVNKLVVRGLYKVPELVYYAQGENTQVKPNDESQMQIIDEKGNIHFKVDRIVYLENDISSGRIHVWKDSLKLWTTAPVFGYGMFSVQDAAKTYIPDSLLATKSPLTQNSFLHILLTTGASGSIFFFTFLALCFFKIVGYIVREKRITLNYFIVVLLFALLGSLTSQSCFLSILFLQNDYYEVIFWATLGMIMYFISKDETDKITILEKLFNKVLNLNRRSKRSA